MITLPIWEAPLKDVIVRLGSPRVIEASALSLILGTVCSTLCVTASILLGVIDSFNTQRQMPVEHFSRPMSEWMHSSSNLFEPTIKLRNCQTKLKLRQSEVFRTSVGELLVTIVQGGRHGGVSEQPKDHVGAPD